MKDAKEVLKNYSHLQYLGHTDFKQFPVKAFSASKSNWKTLHEEVCACAIVWVVTFVYLIIMYNYNYLTVTYFKTECIQQFTPHCRFGGY